AGLVPAADLDIKVLTKRPLNFDATDALTATVAPQVGTPTTAFDYGEAFLASQSDAILGAITVPGETRIKVKGSISNAAAGSIDTGNLILEAAQGSIGSSGTPLALNLGGSLTITARAQGGVYLYEDGTANIDTVYSPQDVSIDAAGSILNANGDLLINVLGTHVTLTAEAGDIGSPTSALNVGVNLGGGITADASGSVYLYGPINSSFVVDSVTAGVDASLTAAVDGEIAGPVDAAGFIDLVAGGTLTIDTTGSAKSTP